MPTLRELRKSKGLNIKDIADATGLSISTLSKVERGIAKPQPLTTRKLAEFFHVSVAELLTFLPSENKSTNAEPAQSPGPINNDAAPVQSASNRLSAPAVIMDALTGDLSALERVQLEAYRDGLRGSRRMEPAVRIPIIGYTAAGFENTVGSEWTGDFAAIPNECLRGVSVSDVFALNVTGRSMEPLIMDGDVAIFRAQSDVQSGEIALVVYGDDLDAIGSYGTVKEVRKEPDGAISLIALNPDFQTRTLRGEDLASVRIQGKLMQIIRTF